MAATDYYGAGPSPIGVTPQTYGAPPPINGNRPEMSYTPQNQGFYQNSTSAPYYPPAQTYYAPQQQPLYATEGPRVSGMPAGGRNGGQRGFLGALLATLCCCCLCDDCCGPAAVAGPAVVPVGAVGPGFGAPIGGGCCDPGCCFIC